MDPVPTDRRYFGLRLLGIPVLLHWTFPAVGVTTGLIVASLFLTTSVSLSLQVFLWTTAAVVILVLIHELGHAVAARVLCLDLVAVVIAHVGGRCFIAKTPSPRQDLLLSAAGVLAQSAVLMATLALLWVLGTPTSLPLKCLVIVFTGGNVLVMAVNLLPSKDNDGARILNALRALWVGTRA
jgi:Zn-dependent protease